MDVVRWKPEIDGQGWLVVRVEHDVGGGGFTTRVEMEKRPDSA